MSVRFFNTPKAQYIFQIWELSYSHPEPMVEIRKVDKTKKGSKKFSVIKNIKKFEEILPLLEARKEELLKTAHKTKTLRGDPYAAPNSDSRMIKVDKAERVFDREMRDIQTILHTYARLKRGELQLKQTL